MATVAQLAKSVKAAKHVYLCGNGGSAANAIHIANDLIACRIKAHALTADVATLTAIANDYSYAEVFSQQLKSQAIDRDGLLVISGSGNSANVIAVLERARFLKVRTMGLLGFGGGLAAPLCDVAVVLDSSEYGPVEVAHDACIHLLKDLLSRT